LHQIADSGTLVSASRREEEDRLAFNSLSAKDAFKSSSSSSSSSSSMNSAYGNVSGINPKVIRPNKMVKRTVRYMDKDGIEHMLVEYRVANEEEVRSVLVKIEEKKRMAQVKEEERRKKERKIYE
jgi:hypothetical protein